MELQIVNISMRNAIMSREFYWNQLNIDRLNETITNLQPHQPCIAQIFAPQMPLNTLPLHIVLDVKNLSTSVDKELKIFRQLLCDCALKRNRGKNEQCPHRNVGEIRPACVEIKAGHIIQLEIVFRYELLGQHAVCFVVGSSNYRIKLHLIVDSIDFNPLTMLLTNKLMPVAIDEFPAVQQAFWFYNPYSVDIQLRLISYNTKLLSLTTDIIVVKSHDHTPIFVTFSPYYVGEFRMKLGIVFNECESIAHIHAECIQCDTIQHFHSPKKNFPSQLNPFVLHSDNLCLLISQYGCSSENLIALENGSKFAIVYEWKDLCLSDFSCEIHVEPREGCLRAGATKLFRITVQSLGCRLKLQMIPLCCLIYRNCSSLLRERFLPDGYFEYTEKGYYEKPQNLKQKQTEYITTLYVNLNVNVLNAIHSTNHAKESNDTTTFSKQINDENFHRNVPETTVSINNDMRVPFLYDANDDEKYMMETLISMTMSERKYEEQKDSHNSQISYLEITQQSTENLSKRFLPLVMSDILFECITSIAREHCFIRSTL